MNAAEAVERSAEGAKRIVAIITREGLWIAGAWSIWRVTGGPKRKDFWGVMRGATIQTLKELKSMVGISIPLINWGPLKWMRPWIEVWITELNRTDPEDGTRYLSLDPEKRLLATFLIPSMMRAALDVAKAVIAKAIP